MSDHSATDAATAQRIQARWNHVFGGETYAYGETPNDFLAAQAHRLPAGARVLCLAEGEGRNAVHLATLGHDVTGVDLSSAGEAKAHALAAKNGVKIAYHVADLTAFDMGENAWDAVVSVFFHGPTDMRTCVHEKVVRALKPGGLLLLEGYTPDQVGRGTGGPPFADYMHTAERVRTEFAGLDFVLLDEVERAVVEGEKHTGLASVLQCVARKPT